MNIRGRVFRLERAIGVAADGVRRCALCEDGEQTTGVVIEMDGVRTRPDPACPGCGRVNAVLMRITVARTAEDVIAAKAAMAAQVTR